MSKQLQQRLSRLQAQKSAQQLEFTKKKQQYESIIQQLQGENAKLRKFIEQNNESISLADSQTLSLHSAIPPSPRNDVNLGKNIRDDGHNTHQLEEVTNQNNILKQELIELTKTYEDQIEQITNYFSKIQQGYSALAAKVAQSQRGDQINDLVQAYQTLLKSFQSQRGKYIEKIEELTGYIGHSQEKQKQMEDSYGKLELELKIVKQQLKIYKRSKVSK